jgi:outer membrane protein TolC
VQQVLAANPDIAKANAGIAALEAKRDQATSGYYPHVAIIGNLSHTENSWDYGYVSARMKDSWMVGIAVQLEVFSGFRTAAAVQEATARRQKLEEERHLLLEGLALQIRQLVNDLDAATRQIQTTRVAMESAAENLDLTDRAYQSDLLEVKDLVEAQILDSFSQAQHQKARYDQLDVLARLELVLGSEANEHKTEQ